MVSIKLQESFMIALVFYWSKLLLTLTFSSTAPARFPAPLATRVVIGSLYRLCFFWLARVNTYTCKLIKCPIMPFFFKKKNYLFLSFFLALPFVVTNVFSVYAVRHERTQYVITAYVARVHVRGRRENWTVSNFLLTFRFNFRACCANGNYCFVNYTSRFPQFKFAAN